MLRHWLVIFDHHICVSGPVEGLANGNQNADGGDTVIIVPLNVRGRWLDFLLEAVIAWYFCSTKGTYQPVPECCLGLVCTGVHWLILLRSKLNIVHSAIISTSSLMLERR